MDAEKLATEKELRKKLELQNAIAEASVLNRSELMKVFIDDRGRDEEPDFVG
jgi:hypothetical protein